MRGHSRRRAPRVAAYEGQAQKGIGGRWEWGDSLGFFDAEESWQPCVWEPIREHPHRAANGLKDLWHLAGLQHDWRLLCKLKLELDEVSECISKQGGRNMLTFAWLPGNTVMVLKSNRGNSFTICNAMLDARITQHRAAQYCSP